MGYVCAARNWRSKPSVWTIIGTINVKTVNLPLFWRIVRIFCEKRHIPRNITHDRLDQMGEVVWPYAFVFYSKPQTHISKLTIKQHEYAPIVLRLIMMMKFNQFDVFKTFYDILYHVERVLIKKRVFLWGLIRSNNNRSSIGSFPLITNTICHLKIDKVQIV